MFRILKARLSWRIAFWVLITIITIEVIIVYPSYQVRKQELLAQLETVGKNTVLPILNLAQVKGEGGDLLPLAEQLAEGTLVLGGAFYLPGGQPLGVFGEPPAISYSGMNENDMRQVLSADGLRYDVAWDHKTLNTRFYTVVRLDASQVQAELNAYVWRMMGFIIIISSFVTAAAMLAVGITTITPILKLHENLLATGEDNGHRIVHLLPTNRPDELGDVMSAFTTMARKIQQRTSQLQSTNVQLMELNQRLQRELTMAQKIQRSLLLPAEPSWNGPVTRCYTTPMSAVGGDFYVYHNQEPGKYGMAVGDVSGKGMPAALLMAVSLASFDSIIKQNVNPNILLTHLDQAIAFYTRTTRLNCALVYMLLEAYSPDDQQTNQADHDHTIYTMTVANAGCIHPIIQRQSGTVEWVNVSGMPLGIGLGAKSGYHEAILPLASGDTVIMCSDGIIEAHNGQGEMFGFERMEETVLNGPQSNADAMLHHIREQVQQFVQEQEAHDDLTLIVVTV
jgi:serine phosphatase RsbU (regulator of sigma subunit)